MLVMDPIVAREFVDRGMDTPETLGKWIYENARVPLASTGIMCRCRTSPEASWEMG
jgi:hypothetical protein